ncbi:PEP-CTERM sorting domain-containing protein [Planctomycetales bacterium ZRK34]|nr:PEP-CTERM sorting domain-containing protein [Planctomycetales bacterium ZRK34]
MSNLICRAITVAVLGVVATSTQAAISISVIDSGDLDPSTTYDLTALGQTDWALFESASLPLTPTQRKAGGSGIGALTLSSGTVGSAATSYSPFFSWTDGDASGLTSATGYDPNHLTSDSSDTLETFSLVLDADTKLRHAYLFVGLGRSQGQLTATLSDDAGSPVSATPYTAGTTGFGHITYLIKYTASSGSQTITLDWEMTNAYTSPALLRLQGAALSIIPEPTTAAMFTLIAGAVGLRRRRV